MTASRPPRQHPFSSSDRAWGRAPSRSPGRGAETSARAHEAGGTGCGSGAPSRTDLLSGGTPARRLVEVGVPRTGRGLSSGDPYFRMRGSTALCTRTGTLLPTHPHPSASLFCDPCGEGGRRHHALDASTTNRIRGTDQEHVIPVGRRHHY